MDQEDQKNQLEVIEKFNGLHFKLTESSYVEYGPVKGGFLYNGEVYFIIGITRNDHGELEFNIGKDQYKVEISLALNS